MVLISFLNTIAKPHKKKESSVCTRDGAVHKIFVRKLHRTTQFYHHTALQKVCELVAQQIQPQVKI